MAEHGGPEARIPHWGAVAPAGSWERQEAAEAAELEESLGSSVPLCSTLTRSLHLPPRSPAPWMAKGLAGYQL